GLDAFALLAKPQHAQRVRDLLQELDQPGQFDRIRLAHANEDIQRILHPREVFLDRDGNRLHQAQVGPGQVRLRGGDIVVRRQQFAEAEGFLDRGDAFAARARLADVIKEIVDQLRRRLVVEPGFAAVDDLLDLAIDLAKHLLVTDSLLDAAVEQRLERAVYHPPELEARGRGRRLLELLHDLRERLESVGLAGLEPAKQRLLEFRTQLSGDLADVTLRRPLATFQFARSALTQALREQRGLREQRLAAHGTEIVQE